MADKLTLAEMAARLRSTPKTFARRVKADNIPYIQYGRSKLFDPAAVEAHLASLVVEDAKVVKFRPSVRKSQKSKFAEAVGLP